MKNVTAVILAAGLGTRMKTETPKVLHKIGSKAMLALVTDSLKKNGIEKVIVVVGYKAEEIEKVFGKELIFVRQKELLGSGNALLQALPEISEDTEDVLVTCGDTPLITEETFRRIIEEQEENKSSCTLLTTKVKNPESYGRIIRDDKGLVLKIVEEKDLEVSEKSINEINVGTYCFKKEELDKFLSEIKLNEKKKEFYLTDIIDILNKSSKNINSVFCDEEESIGINSRRDLAMANKIVNKKKIDELLDSGVTIIDPDNTYIDQDVEIGKDTIVYPNTVIENDVKIASGCKIGPFARLRPGTIVGKNVIVGNFVELCRSTVGEGSKVKHHTYLGDTQVGKNANIGAGTIVANYDGKDKHQTIIEDEVFIGIGVNLIAPVRIGKKAVVGAGSVVTKNKDVLPGEVVAGVPAKKIK